MSVFRPNIDKMKGYVPGIQPHDPDTIKLNTNETPYPPSDAVLQAVKESLNPSLRLYPDPMATPIREAGAQAFNAPPEMILAGNGSDDLLTLPHPRLGERGFVLGPLAELAPDQILPDSGETAASAWARIRDKDGPWLRPLTEPVVGATAMAGSEEEWRAALAVHCR